MPEVVPMGKPEIADLRKNIALLHELSMSARNFGCPKGRIFGALP
jgi:hypothetical protein